MSTEVALGEERAAAPAEPRWRSAARPRAGTPRGRAVAGRARARLVVGTGLLVALVLASVLLPWLGGLDQRAVDYGAMRLPPSPGHPFGTDAHGRDLLLRSFAGLQVSLLVAACAVVSTLLGALFGAASGVLGGWPDRLLMRLVDTVLALLLAPWAGSVEIDGERARGVRYRAPRELRTAVGVVFQQPRLAADPRLTLREIVAEPLLAPGAVANPSGRTSCTGASG